jgi:hypothetical protein
MGRLNNTLREPTPVDHSTEVFYSAPFIHLTAMNILYNFPDFSSHLMTARNRPKLKKTLVSNLLPLKSITFIHFHKISHFIFICNATRFHYCLIEDQAKEAQT